MYSMMKENGNLESGI